MRTRRPHRASLLYLAAYLAWSGCGDATPQGRWTSFATSALGITTAYGGDSIEFFPDRTCVLESRDTPRITCGWTQLDDGRIKIDANLLGIAMTLLATVEDAVLVVDDGKPPPRRFVRDGTEEAARLARAFEANKLNSEAVRLMKQDAVAARELFDKAIELGSPFARKNLANMILRGEGGDKDPERARRLLEAVAESGFEPAMTDLGDHLLWGVFGEPEVDEGVRWLEKARAAGSRNATSTLVWFRATCAEPRFQQREETERLGRELVSLDEKAWRYWGGLAAALARNGSFPEAIEAQEKKLRLLRWDTATEGAEKKKQLANGRRHLALLQASLPLNLNCLEASDREPDRARRGAPNEPSETVVTIVEYGNFQCPFSGRVRRTLDQVMARYGPKVEIVFKHYPLAVYGDSMTAHRSAAAAAEQGRFWEMHDLIFEHQDDLSAERMRQHAKQLGLDMDRFEEALASDRITAAIGADEAEAVRRKVPGTPGFFVNDKYLGGAVPFADFESAIEAQLEARGS